MRLEKKYKVLITLIIVVLAFFGWQLYDKYLMEDAAAPLTPASPASLSAKPSESTAIPSIPLQDKPAPQLPAPAVNPPISINNAAGDNKNSVSTAPTPAASAPIPNMLPVANKITTPVSSAVTAMPVINGQQAAAFEKLNAKYQILKIQRQLAEEQANLLAARLRITVLSQQLDKTAQTQPLCLSGSRDKLNNNPAIAYQLMNIDCQSGQMTAMLLANNNQLIEATPGMTLPQGGRVLKVETNRVIIQQGANTYALNFYGTTLLKPIETQPLAASPSSSKKIIQVTSIKKQPVKKVAKQSVKVKKSAKLSKVTKAPVGKNKKSVASQKITKGKSNTVKKKIIERVKLQDGYQSCGRKPCVVSQNSRSSSAGASAPIPVSASTTAVAAKTELNKPISSRQSFALAPAALANPTANKTPHQTAPIVPGTQTSSSPSMPQGLPINTNNDDGADKAPGRAILARQETTSNIIPLKNATTVAANNTPTPPPLLSKLKEPLPQQVNATHPVVNKARSNDEQHLLTLPKNYYTLQLYGSRRSGDLSELIQRYKLEDSTYVFHTYYLGKDWYVLIYGAYKTEQEALDTIKALPVAVQRLKPWVRTLGSVQNAINVAHG